MLLQKYDSWTLYGSGLALAQVFYGWHRIMFGLSIAIGKFDGISMPTSPSCVFQIHSIREQARTFDNGMYKFLVR